MPSRTSTLASLVLCACLAWSQRALAEATVEVKLRDAGGKPADGEVALVDASDNVVAACTTNAGVCHMEGVPGGSYRARVSPKVGDPPKPRKVMIPPSGKVSLIVSTGT